MGVFRVSGGFAFVLIFHVLILPSCLHTARTTPSIELLKRGRMGVSCSPVPSMSSSTCSLTTASSTPSILLSDGPLYLQLQKLHISSYSVLNSLQTRSPQSRWKCLLLVIIVGPKGPWKRLLSTLLLFLLFGC